MRQASLAVSFALVAMTVWMAVAAMFVHELGHVLAAGITGGTIISVELRPGRLSHTLVRPNPQPGVVLWSGFALGWLAPQATAPLWRIERGMIGQALRAWAAFCLLAGGSYLAIGGGERLTDTGQLIAIGWPAFVPVVVGLVVAALGYWRSRAAWIALADRIGQRRVSATLAFGWWLWLAAWWGGQHAAATWLEP